MDCCFLNNYFQCVVVNVEHCNSEWLPVLSGIPQGTVIGPVLFIIVIEDIGVICSGSVTRKLFADDMKLYSTSDTKLIMFRYSLRLIVYINGAEIDNYLLMLANAMYCTFIYYENRTYLYNIQNIYK